MDLLSVLIVFVVGFALGFGVFWWTQKKAAKQLAGELLRENENQRKENMDAVLESLKDSFGNLSSEALSKSSEEFFKLAKEKLGSERELNTKELDSKKGLIDQQLQRMTSEMEKVSKLMNELEKDRENKFGELATQLKTTNEQTVALTNITSSLNEVLASAKARGEWGERMAEDVLQLAGFIENINYRKQKSIAGGNIPDFTFMLPNGKEVNMDVKFPFDNYRKFLEADSETDKNIFRKDFLKDVKGRIKEVTTRDYINSEQNTLDYVLLFIPNEQIYAFIHEQDSSIMDDGIKNKVVFCSPITLFAVLAVIRQAVENFNLDQASDEILSHYKAFKKQWDLFTKALEAVGDKIASTKKAYDAVMGTRRRELEKPLEKIENLIKQRELPITSEDDGELPLDSDNVTPIRK